jgi:hypothetical protein
MILDSSSFNLMMVAHAFYRPCHIRYQEMTGKRMHQRLRQVYHHPPPHHHHHHQQLLNHHRYRHHHHHHQHLLNHHPHPHPHHHHQEWQRRRRLPLPQLQPQLVAMNDISYRLSTRCCVIVIVTGACVSAIISMSLAVHGTRMVQVTEKLTVKRIGGTKIMDIIHLPTRILSRGHQMKEERYDHLMVPFVGSSNDERFMVIGGICDRYTPDSCEVYDIKLQSWLKASSLPTRQANMYACGVSYNICLAAQAQAQVNQPTVTRV